MKKKWIIAISLALCLFVSSIVFAENPIKVIFHNKEIQSAVSPQIIEGKIMVPLQAIGEELGYDVKFDHQKNTLHIIEKMPPLKLVASLPEANAALYATEKNCDFTNLELRVRNQTKHFPYWRSSANRDIKILYSDINNDEKKELIIVLTPGTGTGVSEREVHVFALDKYLHESLVENPVIVSQKYVETKLTPSEAEIIIGPKKNTINLKILGIQPSHLLNDIAYGSVIDFDVLNESLRAIMPTQLTPGGTSAGTIIITYGFKNNLYYAKKIEFEPLFN